ncbi:MAG: phosphoribosylformylglycinamidine cyclo-ligase [Candidatus Omnitrophica bacterium]|nr:phosphoribosylformylglycinamidine cyclo-ligase [Candidatus Omnitrophota bacterium]
MPGKAADKMITYRKAGVNVRGADAWLARMRTQIRSTRRPEVLDDLGAFGGLFRLPVGRFRDPVLVASTDGVGTKLALANSAADYETIGLDAVAMNVNDILVYGAQPLFFLDYLAVGRLRPALMSPLLRGIVRGCRQSGCALLGGETAEMPGVYRNGDYDVAGFCVGIVERGTLIDGSRVRPGDVIVGLASSGIHANGFSLVRRVLSNTDLARLHRQLLVPTRIYVRPVLEALRRVPVRAMVHITGGGLARRLPALVARRPGLRARVVAGTWPIPRIFRALERAGVSAREMPATFNMGIGMAMVCSAASVPRLVGMLRRRGIAAWRIGTIEQRS